MKKFAYVLYALLFLAITGLLVYDIFIIKSFDPSNLTRYVLLILSLIASVIKFTVAPRRQFLRQKKTYQSAYSDFIRSAFSHDKKLENKLYQAIHDYNRNNPGKGIAKLEKLRKQCQNSDDIYAVTIFTALCYDDLYAYKTSVQLYHAALNLRPHTTLASNLGLCRERLGDQQGAIEAYRHATQLDPKNAYPFNNLAQLYVRMGEYESAIECAKQAVALNSKMHQPLSALAICYYMLGDTSEYERYYRQAVACGSDGNKLKAYLASMDASIDKMNI